MKGDEHITVLIRAPQQYVGPDTGTGGGKRVRYLSEQTS